MLPAVAAGGAVVLAAVVAAVGAMVKEAVAFFIIG